MNQTWQSYFKEAYRDIIGYEDPSRTPIVNPEQQQIGITGKISRWLWWPSEEVITMNTLGRTVSGSFLSPGERTTPADTAPPR